MMTHEQVIAYLEQTLSPDEVAGVEAELGADAWAAAQLTELAQYDAVLQALLGAPERARIEEAVLAAVSGQSLHESGPSDSRPTVEPTPDPGFGNPETSGENNMNDPSKAPNVDNNLTKDQLAAEGILTDLSGADRRQSERYREDLAEEAKEGLRGKPGPGPKPAPAPEAETPGEDRDYYNGLSP